MKRFLIVPLLSLIILSACKDDDPEEIKTGGKDPEVPTAIEVGDQPLSLSCEFGVYPESFTLKVLPVDKTHKILYAIDGTDAKLFNSVFPKDGLTISNTTNKSDYVLTPKVLNYNTWESYEYGYLGKGVYISLLEVDEMDNEVARKRGTYIISPTVCKYDIPVICLSAPVRDWMGTNGQGGLYNTYPNGDNDAKYRGYMEIFNMKTDDVYAVNTQMKRGGNWTRSYPCRTINVNFNKDENGEKNPKLKFELFRNRTMQDGSGKSLAGKLTRFRLHSGGNTTFSSYFSDAFVHELCRMKTNVATTAYQPCMLYLNAEYWGLYTLREHYSDVYFEYNFGVDKNNVQYVDKVYNGLESNASYKRYHFDIQEGTEAEVLAELDDLFSFLGYDYKQASTLQSVRAKDWDVTGWDAVGEGTKYAEFCKRVDVESLIDLVLIQGYCSNWDFMYNNLRMWRSKVVDPANKYADGRWRFMLHDVDFAFEDGTADNCLKSDDGYTGSDVWEKRGISYFDYYMGNAYLNNGSEQGYLKPYNYLLLYLPAQNPEFRKLVWERAQKIAELFNPDDAVVVWDRMKKEIEPYYADRVARWGKQWYTVNSWNDDTNYRRERIYNRVSSFLPQVKKAFKIED